MNCLDCLGKQSDIRSWLLHSKSDYTLNSSSSSTIVSIGSLSNWPLTTRNGHATIGHHAGGKGHPGHTRPAAMAPAPTPVTKDLPVTG